MSPVLCTNCGEYQAISGDILCETCSERYSQSLRNQRTKTIEVASRIDGLISGAGVAPTAKVENLQGTSEHFRHGARSTWVKVHSARIVGSLFLTIGTLVITTALIFASTILAFIGLGLVFWGVLSFFLEPNDPVVQPTDASVMFYLKTIERIASGLGYREKGVYIQDSKNKVVLFIPTEPFSLTPSASEMEGRTFLTNPEGIIIVPPGLEIAHIIENGLGFKLKKCGVETLIEALPKILVEEARAVHDVEITVENDLVKFRLQDSRFAEICAELRDTTNKVGLGCPLCSGLAIVLTIATDRSVVYEEVRISKDNKNTYSTYRLVESSRGNDRPPCPKHIRI